GSSSKLELISAKLENKVLKLNHEMLLLEHKLLTECLKNIPTCTCSEEHKKHLETREIAQLEAEYKKVSNLISVVEKLHDKI
ncbi:hypothetical protein A4A49_00478, partial [Nicotiana attenuata]